MTTLYTFMPVLGAFRGFMSHFFVKGCLKKYLLICCCIPSDEFFVVALLKMG